MDFSWYLDKGTEGLDPARMGAALRTISADDCRYPCGKWMSSRTMARVGLGRELTCDHDGPCNEPEPDEATP